MPLALTFDPLLQ